MQWWSPAVTIIDNRPADMAGLVTRLLLQQVNGERAPSARPKVHRVQTRLEERHSVAPLPARAHRPRALVALPALS